MHTDQQGKADPQRKAQHCRPAAEQYRIQQHAADFRTQRVVGAYDQLEENMRINQKLQPQQCPHEQAGLMVKQMQAEHAEHQHE